MKAKIQGIEVEGTPEEITALKLKLENQLNDLLEKFKKQQYQYEYVAPIYIHPTSNPNPLYRPFVTCCSGSLSAKQDPNIQMYN